MAQNGWMQRLADGADLYGEQLPGVPVVELAGDRRVLIERHSGVTRYSPCVITVKVSYGVVHINGTGLELTQMTRHQLVISGCIQAISLERRF